MSENIIEVNNVTKKFNFNKGKSIFESIKNKSPNSRNSKLVALENISFEVKKGEVLGIIGYNGSGKTTLLQVIAGVYQPDSGNIVIRGTMAPILHIGTGFHKELYPEENIILYGMLLGFSKNEIKEKINDILEFAELKHFSTMKLKHFSSGMRARLGFSTILQLNPDILLIDEVLSVGDIKFKKKSLEAFSSFKDKGKSILLATHSIGTVVDFCDRVLLLHKGKIMNIGEPKEIINEYKKMSSTLK